MGGEYLGIGWVHPKGGFMMERRVDERDDA
jgi:hypothetical protein